MADQPNKHVNQADMVTRHELWYELELHRGAFKVLTMIRGRPQYVAPTADAVYGYKSGAIQFTNGNTRLQVFSSKFDRVYVVIGNGKKLVGAIRVSDDNGISFRNRNDENIYDIPRDMPSQVSIIVEVPVGTTGHIRLVGEQAKEGTFMIGSDLMQMDRSMTANTLHRQMLAARGQLTEAPRPKVPPQSARMITAPMATPLPITAGPSTSGFGGPPKLTLRNITALAAVAARTSPNMDFRVVTLDAQRAGNQHAMGLEWDRLCEEYATLARGKLLTGSTENDGRMNNLLGQISELDWEMGREPSECVSEERVMDAIKLQLAAERRARTRRLAIAGELAKSTCEDKQTTEHDDTKMIIGEPDPSKDSEVSQMEDVQATAVAAAANAADETDLPLPAEEEKPSANVKSSGAIKMDGRNIVRLMVNNQLVCIRLQLEATDQSATITVVDPDKESEIGHSNIDDTEGDR